MIVYYYMLLNFVFEGKIVLFVVFVRSACRVQKYLVENYYLVDQYFSSFFSWFMDILLLILIETQQLK